MLELLLTVIFFLIFFKVLGLAARLTWGLTKLIVSALFVIALPLLAVGLVFAGGLILLVPLGLVALALGIVKAAV